MTILVMHCICFQTTYVTQCSQKVSEAGGWWVRGVIAHLENSAQKNQQQKNDKFKLKNITYLCIQILICVFSKKQKQMCA